MGKISKDTVSEYGAALGWEIRPKTVLVEGTTDVNLLNLAAKLTLSCTGTDLFNDELAIIAAGEGERGGTHGVIRELVAFRGLARTVLLPNGMPKYRFVGLFDNDRAGILAVKFARDLDASIIEFKDIFRLRPIMPTVGNLDPKTLGKTFETHNAAYKGIDWELEDLIDHKFIDAFCSEQPSALIRKDNKNDLTHYEFTKDGKAQLHRFVQTNAIYEDVLRVVDVIKALRFYLCLSTNF